MTSTEVSTVSVGEFALVLYYMRDSIVQSTMEDIRYFSDPWDRQSCTGY
jgi:hypothetical protein